VDPWQLVDYLVDVALAADPATEAEQLLRALLGFTGGSRAAIFELRLSDGLRLFASRGIDQAALETVEACWQARRAELCAGRAVVSRGAVLHPVTLDEHLAGVMYTDGFRGRSPEPRDLQALSQFARVAGHALAGRRSEPARYLGATSPHDVARDQLLVLLELHEWNISRVSRELGVTRPTVYARLERYGLPRLRPPKHRKRQPA
jgi:hypothetical protein